MGYIYINHNDGSDRGYEVGYHLTKYSHGGKPYNQFYCETRWATPEEAAARVNYLNGGTGDPPTTPVPREQVSESKETILAKQGQG